MATSPAAPDTADQESGQGRGKRTARGASKRPVGPGTATNTAREESRTVSRYLEALSAHKPKRGRRRDPGSLQMRLDQITTHLSMADPLSRVHMIQERLNIEAELRASGDNDGLASLEEAFVSVARRYGERRGVTYAAWREAGVSAAVLKRAGVTRRGRS